MPEEKVLVVDDEDMILNLCTEILSREGYKVTAVPDGFKAIEEVKNRPFDLLITDLRMPGMNGMELYSAIKELKDDITTIIITGYGTVDTAIESLKKGIEGFILKPFSQKELIDSVSLALQKNRLIRENIRLKALIPLIEINRMLITEIEIEGLFNTIMDTALSEIGADRVSIMLLEEGTDEISVRASKGLLDERVRGFRTKIGEDISGWVAQRGEGLLLNDGIHHDPIILRSMRRNVVYSGMCVPLNIKGRILGVINLSKIRPGIPFTKGDLDLFSIIAGQMSVSLENARLYKEIKENYFKTILALAAAIETKDPYTKGHSSAVARHALAIAQEVGLSKERLEEIYIAGILHDVGKIGISEQLLCKEGKLTDEEYLIMQEHPSHAKKILEPVGFSEWIIKSICYHHEWFNGTGYPDGLKGEEIPLGARILCVADTIDAMSSERFYRGMMSLERIIKELKQGSGTQFDPEVTEAAIRLLEKGMIYF